MLENFACGKLDSRALECGIHLKESGIPLTIGTGARIQVPLTKTGMHYLEPGIHGVESRIQDCLKDSLKWADLNVIFYLSKEQLGFKKLSGRFTTMEKSTANELKTVFHS